MSGHSAGSASTIAAMVRDPRIDAGINVDGTTDTGGASMIPNSGITRPFLWLGNPEHVPGGPDRSRDAGWARMTGEKRWLTVAGTDHSSFTDFGIIADQVRIDIGATTSGVRSTEITRRYTRAMFDQFLRRRHQPLLDRGSPRYPEVAIVAR